MIGMSPQYPALFGIAEDSETKHTIVNVPRSSVDLSLLSEYISMIFPIQVEISDNSKVVKMTGAHNELCNAQNFALRFLGPESKKGLAVPLEILELCTIKTMRRYFALSHRVIVTVIGKKTLVLRGPHEATTRLEVDLKNLLKCYKSNVTSFFNPKKNSLKTLCAQLSIDYAQLGSLTSAMKSGLYELLMSGKLAKSLNASQLAGDTSCRNSTAIEPPYIEAFREPKEKRLRPVIIDGANVAHSNVKKSVFNPKNLRYTLDYFLARGHDDIMFVMHGVRQGICSSVFSMQEIAKYFTFTSYRRFTNKNSMIADDDSVILEFALKKKAVVISNDQYRDWLTIRPDFREVIEDRVLPFSINGDIFVISHLPMGKAKPPLDEILCFQD